MMHIGKIFNRDFEQEFPVPPRKIISCKYEDDIHTSWNQVLRTFNKTDNYSDFSCWKTPHELIKRSEWRILYLDKYINIKKKLANTDTITDSTQVEEQFSNT